MAEKSVGLIPRITVQGGLGPKEYGVLITDQRLILVLQKASKSMVGGILGGAIGAIVADSLASKKDLYFAGMDPETVAKDEKNLVIPYHSLQKLALRRNFAGAFLIKFEYVNPEGKFKKTEGFLVPPDALVSQRKTEGVKLSAVREEYAKKAQEMLRSALPPSIIMSAEWLS